MILRCAIAASVIAVLTVVPLWTPCQEGKEMCLLDAHLKEMRMTF